MGKELILQELKEAAFVLEKFMSDEENIDAIDAASDVIVSAINDGGKVFSCGN